jgi:hypothetical protein
LMLCCSIALFSCGGSNEASSSKEAAGWYKFEFDIEPATTIHDIKAKQIVVGDAARAWLRFRASKQDVDLLISRGFHPILAHDFEQELNLENGNAPSWWQVSKNSNFYSKRPKIGLLPISR